MTELNATELDAVARYVERLSSRLGDQLIEVWLFGSAARGDLWGPGSPMHSDIDLLVLTRSPPGDDLEQELVNETYPLFLEHGRQASPHFKCKSRFDRPRDAKERRLVERVRRGAAGSYSRSFHIHAAVSGLFGERTTIYEK
jgi:predicted nucleotidyltransferase